MWKEIKIGEHIVKINKNNIISVAPDAFWRNWIEYKNQKLLTVKTYGKNSFGHIDLVAIIK